MPEAKQPENEKQKQFFKLLIKNKGKVPVTLEAMGDEAYDYAYAYHLCQKYREYVLDLAESHLLLEAIHAASVIVDTMSEDGANPAAGLNLTAAKEVLDRIGLAKQERIKMEVDMPNAIFFLPAKDKKDEDT